MDFAAVHPPCGTEVRDDLPAGYPVQEGVGLWCRGCNQSWWALPEAAEPEVEHVVVDMDSRRAPPPVVEHVASPGGTRGAPPRRWLAPAIALVAFVLLAVAVATTATRPGSSQDQVSASTPEPTPSSAAVAVVTPEPTPAPRTLTRKVNNRRITLTLQPGWTLARHRNGLTARGPGTATVRITAGPRRGRTLRQLGRDARGARTPLRRIKIDGHPAVAVTNRTKRIIQIPDGRRRWLISRPGTTGAALVSSLKIRPAAA